jgi:hypothetical protein
MVDKVKADGGLVTALFQAIEHGQNRIASVPGLLKQVIQEDAWRQFALPHSVSVRQYQHFSEFVQDYLGISIDDLKAICTSRADHEALDLIDRVTTAQHGGDHSKVDNVSLASASDGNSNTYALRKLRKDAPEIHAQVIAGELSPNAGMVKAGFRVKTFTIKVDTHSTVKAIQKHFNHEQRQEIIELLRGSPATPPPSEAIKP